MDRRQALRLITRGGISAGVLAGAGLYARHAFLPPPRSAHLESADRLAVQLFESLEPSIRDRACVDYDHPLRQYHNRGVSGGGIEIDTGTFTRHQRSLLTDLLHVGLSQEGRERLPHQFFINWPGVHMMRLLICGDPRSAAWQIILSGPHLNLRVGGRSREGVAFGGPQIYGDQRGDGRQGLPGNVYRYQFEAAQRLFRALEPRQQQAALLSASPIQTQIDLQGRHGTFPGLEIAEISRANRALAGDLVDRILSTYATEDVAYARRCLEENGGIDRLHLSYYEDGEVDGSGEYQVFRLEGPAAVLYFRGFPHVHAFINIGIDGDAPLSVGEVLGENPRALDGEAVQALFERAMRDGAGTDLAFYAPESVAGRLRRGTIRAGDIYDLESWQDRVLVGELRGNRIGGPLRERARRAGEPVDAERLYTVATTGYVVEESAASVGVGGSWRRGDLLRDVTIAHIKERGFGA